jgi:hypothetical protein
MTIGYKYCLWLLRNPKITLSIPNWGQNRLYATAHVHLVGRSIVTQAPVVELDGHLNAPKVVRVLPASQYSVIAIPCEV